MAPFPASHTGKNISLGLDTMIESLGLNGEQWNLFSVNDNASNMKLGIKMSKLAAVLPPLGAVNN